MMEEISTKGFCWTWNSDEIFQCVNINIGEGNGKPLQYSCLENPMDGGAWWTTVHGVTESRTWLSDFTLTFHFHALEKEMATHSSVLAWRIPGSGEPGGMPSMGSHRVRHDWSDLAAVLILATCTSNPELFTCYPLCWIPSHIFSHGWVILMLQFSDK